MNKRLPQDLTAVLNDVIKKRGLDDHVELLAADGQLQDRKREELIDTLAAELMETGLGQDDEPNARGLQLEAIIDWINRPNGHAE